MIFVECKPDLLLVGKITGKSKKELLHSGNKGGVIKNLSRSKGAIGVVDEDPGHAQPKYIHSMVLLFSLFRVLNYRAARGPSLPPAALPGAKLLKKFDQNF